MTSPNLFMTSPSKQPPLDAFFKDAFSKSSTEQRVRIGYAYATEWGLDALLEAADGISSWSGAKKDWIIGLHDGLSQPKAIERIRALNGARVRATFYGKKLDERSLSRGGRFHAKVIAVNASAAAPLSILAGSANLSFAALGSKPRNYEAGMSSLALAKNQEKVFNAWWKTAWNEAKPVTDDLLDRYAKVRGPFLRRNPVALAAQDPPSPVRVSAASNLWIEAGAMSGGARNQVEFNRELAAYFGPPSGTRRILRVRYGGVVWDDRPLSPKRTTFGVDIWRLSLPTAAQGGPHYEERVIRFTRRTDHVGPLFDLDVADSGSAKNARWRQLANRAGHLASTGLSQREYGLW